MAMGASLGAALVVAGTIIPMPLSHSQTPIDSERIRCEAFVPIHLIYLPIESIWAWNET
jgi:hypothetical protein